MQERDLRERAWYFSCSCFNEEHVMLDTSKGRELGTSFVAVLMKDA
jgi:hypothetical protein